MTTKLLSLSLAPLLFSASISCTSEPPLELSDVPLFLDDNTSLDFTEERTLDYKVISLGEIAMPFGAGTLTSPDQCHVFEEQLQQACSEVSSSSYAGYCYAYTVFLQANSIPRCAGRVHARMPSTSQGNDYTMETIYAFDISGVSNAVPLSTCGDGEIDEGEECDDGNRELWDGCDSDCKFEPFNGCEAVIEDYYRDAEIANVSKDTWQGDRSHLMVNKGSSIGSMNEGHCAAAISLGTDVCNELQQAMPFVAGCYPEGEYVSSRNECNVRLHVGFGQVAPESGVYSTGLGGVLSFTIAQ